MYYSVTYLHICRQSKLFHPCVSGIDKWIQLTPISKDDDVQGEVLVEMSMEPATESEVQPDRLSLSLLID